MCVDEAPEPHENGGVRIWPERNMYYLQGKAYYKCGMARSMVDEETGTQYADDHTQTLFCQWNQRWSREAVKTVFQHICCWPSAHARQSFTI